jgi:mannose-6-phosphate isomerase-like protein (cupin superfamily)
VNPAAPLHRRGLAHAAAGRAAVCSSRRECEDDPVTARTNRVVPEGVAAAPDLASREPRPFGLELDGYAHLPRMLDKARAALAGTAGTYRFGCPVDHTCMARLGIAPEVVLDLAARHADDHRLLQELRDAHGIPPAEQAWFDSQAVEDELQDEGIYLRVRARDDLPEQPLGRLFAGADHDAEVDVVLVELGPGDGAEQPATAAAHVWVVQEGEARFFLGERQARIVRAGEVVRVPANVPWRVENSGDATLRAVAVGAARPPA